MSGFAVIVDFSGAPVAAADLAAMCGAIAYRGPDGIGSHVAGPVAMAQLLMLTGAGPERAAPLASADGALVLVMDGYLTHPEELRRRLEDKGAALRGMGDAELLLQAYATWGADAPREVMGEYAFVVWDARRREVFAARDHAGLRPLHYAWNGHRLTIASDLGGVLADPQVPRRPNAGLMAEFMANEWLTLGETLWEDVRPLRAAHHLRAASGRLAVTRYWMPPTEAVQRYRREVDYFEHYREVLEDSVRRASRTDRPLGCEVSGGLDSSAVFALAHGLAGRGELPAPDLKGYTFAFPPGHSSDEGHHARAVAEHLGRPIRGVAPFAPDLEWFARRGRDDGDFPPYPNGAQAIAVGAAATADGCRVMLNGEGGDEFATGYALHYHEDLARLGLAAVMRSLVADWRDHGGKAALGAFARHGLGPFAPPVARRWHQRRRTNRAVRALGEAYWIAPRLRGLLQERRMRPELPEFAAIANRCRRAMYMNMNEPFTIMVRDVISRQSARGGYECRSPMYSRTFVEFMFTLPENLRLRGGVFKYIHVKALDPILPASVLARRDKANFMPAIDRAVLALGPLVAGEFFARYPEYIDNEGIKRLFEAYVAGLTGVESSWQLWGCYSCGNMLGRTT